jgi:hypothetical protein
VPTVRPYDLLVAAGEGRQLGGPAALLVEVGDDDAVARSQVVVAGGGQAPVQLVLDGEQQLGGQHAKARVLTNEVPTAGGLAANLALGIHL